MLPSRAPGEAIYGSVSWRIAGMPLGFVGGTKMSDDAPTTPTLMPFGVCVELNTRTVAARATLAG